LDYAVPSFLRNKINFQIIENFATIAKKWNWISRQSFLISFSRFKHLKQETQNYTKCASSKLEKEEFFAQVDGHLLKY